MKRIYLPAVELLKFEDLGIFLIWFASQPMARMSMARLQKTAPLHPRKLGAMLRLLEQFAFVQKEPDAVSISSSGLKFCRAEQAIRKAMVRNQFLTVWPIVPILSQLDASGAGFLSKREVFEVLKEGTSSQITDQIVTGVMTWGHCCELFRFDRIKQGICREVIKRSLPSGALAEFEYFTQNSVQF